jgi:myo-inositol-1(or 4)-monophosphatase
MYQRELMVLLAAIEEAGKEILRLQREGLTLHTKANNSIVTQADLCANDILKHHLQAHFPDDGWLSEETADNESRLQLRRVWIVDPIDGTKEFAAGLSEFAVSVALVEGHEAVVGAIYNPAQEFLCHAIKNQGAFQGKNKLSCIKGAKNCKILASRTEYEKGEWANIIKTHAVQPIGSVAYKLALVAAGKAHATFSLQPKSEWDIAAGVLLVQEAGGMVMDQDQQSFSFNQPNVRVSSVVASAAICHPAMMDLVAANRYAMAVA